MLHSVGTGPDPDPRQIERFGRLTLLEPLQGGFVETLLGRAFLRVIPDPARGTVKSRRKPTNLFPGRDRQFEVTGALFEIERRGTKRCGPAEGLPLLKRSQHRLGKCNITLE